MGCGVSAQDATHGDGKLSGGGPAVAVRAGDNVRKLNVSPKIIFVFGGPGSKKGEIIDELANTFGFQLLSAEELILRHLPKKIENAIVKKSIDTTVAVQRYLKDDPSLLTLEWALHLIETEIEEAPSDSAYIIDVMPNLRFLLVQDLFVKDCTVEMTNFEGKFPCHFAINLAVPEGKKLNDETYRAKSNDIREFRSNGSSSSSSSSRSSGNSGGNSSSGATSDEADLSRTQKRRARYETCVNFFLDYFHRSGRLLTIDASSGRPKLVGDHLREHLLGLGFSLGSAPSTAVIVFCFDVSELHGLDVARYGLTRISLKAAADEETRTFENALDWVCGQVDEFPSPLRSFLVEVDGTAALNHSLNRVMQIDESGKLKSPVFVEVEEVQLDKFIFVVRRHKHHRKSNRKTSLFQKRFKAVSASDREVCLFPITTDTQLCKDITQYVSDHRRSQS